MINRLTVILLFLVLALGLETFGQLRIDKIIPPSFNASAIIKYCDHPVGYKYGTPKIRFPMRTLIDQDLYIPITLNYHPLGIRVEEEATWTGLGWYLQAGGMITRIVRGENDLGIVDFKEETKAKGYPFEHIKPCFDDCADNENDEFHAAVCAGEIDSDPDIFFFDILGITGKFLLTPDHSPDTDRIEINIVTPRKMTISFLIAENAWEVKDARGYVYLFRTRETTYSLNNYFDYKYETHKIQFDYQASRVTSTWYLDRVTSPKGARAIFEYDVSPDGTTEYLSDGTFQKMNINDEDIWDVHYSSYCFPENIDNVSINSQNQYSDVYLSSIRCGDFYAEFSKSEQHGASVRDTDTDEKHRFFSDIPPGHSRQQLNQLQIHQSGELVSSAKFHYSLFSSTPDDNLPLLHHRLRLDSLVTSGRGKSKSVQFGYYDKYTLPSKESHARDLWGFYNGEEDLYNITPSDFFNYSQPEKMLQEEGRTKHYSLDHIQCGVLNEITYQGGKKTRYFYDHQEFFHIDDEISTHFESNMASSNFKHALNPFLFGGLRIKEIIEEYPGEQIYKEFDYTINNKENGKLVITHYSHDHDGFGHKTSGNHCVKYEKVNIKSGKLLNGTKF